MKSGIVLCLGGVTVPCGSPSLPFREVGNGRLRHNKWIWSEKDLNQPKNVANDAAYFRFLCAQERYFAVDK